MGPFSAALVYIRDVLDELSRQARACSINFLSAAWSFLKLTKRRIPIELLIVLENWSSSSDACVKCKKVWSNCFQVNFGVRQGSVLSPYLCNISLDDRLNDCYERSSL